jgi:hypothetical protein
MILERGKHIRELDAKINKCVEEGGEGSKETDEKFHF